MTKLSKDMRAHAAHKCMYRSEVKIIKDPVNQGKIWSILLCLTGYLITTSLDVYVHLYAHFAALKHVRVFFIQIQAVLNSSFHKSKLYLFCDIYNPANIYLFKVTIEALETGVAYVQS